MVVQLFKVDNIFRCSLDLITGTIRSDVQCVADKSHQHYLYCNRAYRHRHAAIKSIKALKPIVRASLTDHSTNAAKFRTNITDLGTFKPNEAYQVHEANIVTVAYVNNVHD